MTFKVKITLPTGWVRNPGRAVLWLLMGQQDEAKKFGTISIFGVLWQGIYRVISFIANIFWKHYNSFISLWNYLNFWYVTYWHLIYDSYFINFFKMLTISGQKSQICERTLKFLLISTRPQWICKFCAWFSSGKTSSFKKSQKTKIWGCRKKCLFCLFCTEKLNSLISFFVLSGSQRSELPSYYRK